VLKSSFFDRLCKVCIIKKKLNRHLTKKKKKSKRFIRNVQYFLFVTVFVVIRVTAGN